MEVLPLPRWPIRHTFRIISGSTATRSSFPGIPSQPASGGAFSLTQGWSRRSPYRERARSVILPMVSRERRSYGGNGERYPGRAEPPSERSGDYDDPGWRGNEHRGYGGRGDGWDRPVPRGHQ